MSNTYLDKAIEAVPELGNRISLFTKKLRLAQYADSTIYSYRLKISQAVLYLGKLPDDFTQADIDDYLNMLLDRNRYSLSFFKHTVFGLKEYYKNMGLKEPRGLVLPRVRKPKRLPRVLSQEQMKRLISLCDLYDKALISTIYDCALRVSEACSLKWIDISFERQQVFIYQGKAKKDRCVQISEQLLRLLPAAIALNLVACHQRDARMYHQYRKLGRRSHILISVMRRAGRLVSARIVVASAS